MSLVLDSSTTLGWAYADEHVPYADAVLRDVQRHGAWVPSIWSLEIANALLVGERRLRITATDTRELLDSLAALPIQSDADVPNRVWTATMAIARVQHLTAYDAAYLELALRLDLPLATLDSRLRAAARQIGVGLDTTMTNDGTAN